MTREEWERQLSDMKKALQVARRRRTMCKGALAEKLESIARVRGIECDIHMHKLNYFELVHP